MKKKCFAIILSALLLSSLAVSAFADPPAAPPGGFGESGGQGGSGGPGGAPGSSASVEWTGATTINSTAEQSGQTNASGDGTTVIPTAPSVPGKP